MICKILFLSYRAALAARTPRSHTWQLQQPVGVLTVFLVPGAHGAGHGVLHTARRVRQRRAVPARRGQRLACLPGPAAASLATCQGRRRAASSQACPGDGGGGPACAPAGCNLCTGAKGTYHPPRYMKRKKIRGKISEIAV